MKICYYILLALSFIIVSSCSNSSSDQATSSSNAANTSTISTKSDKKPVKAKNLMKNEYYKELYAAGISVDKIRKLNELSLQHKKALKKLKNSNTPEKSAVKKKLADSHNDDIKAALGSKDFGIKSRIDKQRRKLRIKNAKK